MKILHSRLNSVALIVGFLAIRVHSESVFEQAPTIGLVPNQTIQLDRPPIIKALDLFPTVYLLQPARSALCVPSAEKYGGINSEHISPIELHFSVDFSTVATVDQSGRIQAVGEGLAVVTVESRSTIGVRVTALVIVSQTTGFDSLTLSSSSLSFSQFGEASNLIVYGLASTIQLPINTYEGIHFASTNPEVATVTNDGHIIATGPGFSAINVEYGILKASATVSVGAATLEAININAAKQTLRSFGDTTSLTTTALLPENQVLDITSPQYGTTYRSSNQEVAVVVSSGVVMAVGNGKATITAMNRGLSASTAITVDTSPLVSLAIIPTSGTISLSSLSPLTTQQLSVQGRYSDNTFDDLTSSNTGTSYTSSNPAIASVSPSGLVAFTQPGNVTIRAANGTVTSSATFQVSTFSPVPLGQINISGANNVKAAGAFAYVTTGSGLSVVDVSQPKAPHTVGNVGLGGSAVDLAVRSGLVYVANGANVAIVNVSSPSAPSLAGNFVTGGNVQAVGLSADGSTLYVGDDQGLKIAGLADPLHPALLGSAALGGPVAGLALGSVGSSPVVYVSRGDQMSVVDVSSPSASIVRGSIALDSRGIAANGAFAYLASGTNGVKVIDASNPDAPVIAGGTNIQMNAQGVVAKGFLVLTAENIFVNSMPIFNMSNPQSPAYVGVLNFPGDVDGTRVDANDSLVYLVGSGNTLEIGAYAQPRTPVLPAVQLTLPSSGTTVLDGGLAQMSATASDAIGIQQVNFLVNGIAQVAVSSAPFAAGVRLPTGIVGKKLTLGAQAVNLFGVSSAVSTTTVNVVADPLTTVRGRLVNIFGQPVSNASVSIFNDKFQVTTDTSGVFSAQNVPTALGFVTLSATATIQAVQMTAFTKVMPVLAGVTDFGDVLLTAQTRLAGDLPAVLDVLHSPYIATADITVPIGQTLVLQPGTVIKMSKGTNFNVNGTLLSQGTSASPVMITSLSDDSALGDTNKDGPSQGAPGDWNILTFGNGSPSSQLAHTRISFGAQVSLFGASPQFNTVTISTMSRVAISADLSSFPSGSGNIASGSPLNGIDLPSGSINASGVWGLIGIPYVIRGNQVSLQADKILTLLPGVVVKSLLRPGNDGRLTVLGRLNAVGTSTAPIIFTSLRDSSAGGETDAFEGDVPAAPGDWWYVGLYGPSNRLSYVQVRYGGAATGTNVFVSASTGTVFDHCQISNSRVDGIQFAAGATGLIEGSTIQANAGSGVHTYDLGSGPVDLVNNLFLNNKGFGASLGGQTASITGNIWDGNGGGVAFANSTGTPVLSGNVFQNNQGDLVSIYPNVFLDARGANIIGPNNLSPVIQVIGQNDNVNPRNPGTWTQPTTWNSTSIPYSIRYGEVIFLPGAPLTLAPGVVVKFQQAGYVGRLHMLDKLTAVGTSTAPIILTSLRDSSAGGNADLFEGNVAPAPGDWSDLVLDGPGASGSQLSFVQIRYGGAGDSTNLLVTGSTGTVLNSCQISSSSVDGIQFVNGATGSVQDCAIRGNNRVGILTNSSSNPSIHNTIFSANNTAGLQNNDSSITIQAPSNYWGSPTGPTNSSNPSGTGDAVSDHVTFVPFLTAPP
jgi:hypothetical protein